MKKFYLLFVINCFLVGGLLAQQAVFSVILNKGDNSYGTGESYSPVLLGTSISEKDVLKVVDGGYVALVHEATGASLELTKKGSYEVAAMEKNVLKQSSTVLAKYGKFLMDKLNPDDRGNQNLNVTGAVERGEVGLIKVHLPKVIDIYGPQAFVSWQQIDDVQEYMITIKDKLDDIISEKPVKGANCIIELNSDQLKDEKIIIINVRAKDNDELHSRDFGIRRLAKEESKSIGKEFASLIKVANSENVLDKLLIASFFEENRLLVDAITYYNQALALSPDPDGFNKLYDNFLVRNEIKK